MFPFLKVSIVLSLCSDTSIIRLESILSSLFILLYEKSISDPICKTRSVPTDFAAMPICADRPARDDLAAIHNAGYPMCDLAGQRKDTAAIGMKRSETPCRGTQCLAMKGGKLTTQ